MEKRGRPTVIVTLKIRPAEEPLQGTPGISRKEFAEEIAERLPDEVAVLERQLGVQISVEKVR